MLHIDHFVSGLLYWVRVFIPGKKEGCASSWSLVSKIRRLLQSDWEVKIYHVYREANKCADVLANMGCDLAGTEVILMNLRFKYNSI